MRAEARAVALARAAVTRLAARFAGANRGLVAKAARRHRGRGLDYEDLLQEGTLGLMEAIERFDWRRGVRFSTYATRWVHKMLVEAVESQGRTVRVPRHVYALASEVKRAGRELEAATGRPAYASEIAGHLGVERASVELALAARQALASLDEETAGGARRRGDFVPDLRAPDPYDRVFASERRALVSRAVSRLTPRQAEVVRLRFGLEVGAAPMTAPEVARALAISESRVRSLGAAALARLREDALLESVR